MHAVLLGPAIAFFGSAFISGTLSTFVIPVGDDTVLKQLSGNPDSRILQQI